MAKRLVSLTLNANSVVTIRRGDLQLDKGKALAGIALVLTIPIANASGGNAALADSDRAKVLDAFKINMKYGAPDSPRLPFQNVSLKTMRRLARFCFASDVDGWSDTTTGLKKSITNNTTSNVVCQVIIPTGKLWMLGRDRENLFAMGRSQARSMELRIERQTESGLTSGFSIGTAVTADVFPVEVSVKGDRVAWIPEYRLRQESNQAVDLDDGLPLFVNETSAAHASTSLTRINLLIGAESIHKDGTPTQILREYNQIPNYPAAGLITDEETVLYQATPDRNLQQLQSGPVHVEQPNKDLTTWALEHYYLPVVDATSQKQFLADAANNWRMKDLKLTSENVIDHLNLPDRMTAFVPGRLLDAQDRETAQYPGIAIPYRGTAADAKVYVPQHVASAARQLAQTGAPGDAVKQLSRALPTTAPNGRGISPTTPDATALRSITG